MKKSEEKIAKEIINKYISILGISGNAEAIVDTTSEEETLEVALETQDTSWSSATTERVLRRCSF